MGTETAMALAENRCPADGAYHRRKSGGRAMQDKQASNDASALRAAAWVGVVFAAIGLLGLMYLPSLWPVWIVMLVFAMAAVPQMLFAERFQQRRKRNWGDR
jgi:fatty acid desaturase